MTTLTKYAASTWRFPGSSGLLLVECIATVFALRLSSSQESTYQPFSGIILRHLPLVTLAKALNMYLSFVAMRLTSLPVYNVLKRLQPVYALLQDRVIRGSVPQAEEFVAVLLMCVGTMCPEQERTEFQKKENVKRRFPEYSPDRNQYEQLSRFFELQCRQN
eukprot:2220866-Amphidinium_carterae.1